MRKTTIIIMALSMVTFAAFGGNGRSVLLDNDWQFCYGNHEGAQYPEYNASAWRVLDLPHDWSVETVAAIAAGDNTGPFSKNSIGENATGYTVGGEGWYRKHFSLSEEDAGQLISLYFEGVYNHAEIWLNGQQVYFNPYGYSSFRVEISEYCKPAGEDNVLVVKVSNEGLNTRWYAGSGIYRHVWMEKTPCLYMASWDTYLSTTRLMADAAEVRIQSYLTNKNAKKVKANLRMAIQDTAGREVASLEMTVSMAANSQYALDETLLVPKAALWSPQSPSLYQAIFTLTDKKHKTSDNHVVRFGIRTLDFSADQGFLLNGEPVLLQGGCVHHDHGLLGAASYDRAEDRKVALLKAQGFNALRCSHNPPSVRFLDACDSIGMMVIDEAFDQWLVAKNANDYHQYFEAYSERDLQTMVRRDRNHPCIIMWSIGNEIPGRIEPDGLNAAERMRLTVLALDSLRPVTAAIPEWDNFRHSWEDNTSKAFKSLDVGGYNYLYGKYERDHENYPQRVMYGAESYPKQASQNWDLVERCPYVIGDFVWTAMDYLGEAGIGSASMRTNGNQSMFQSWPWFNGWCGDIDLIGQKKPQSYYRDVVWHLTPITMAVQEPVPAGHYQSISAWGWQLESQSWTFDDADTLAVNVYARSPKVRLYLNNKLIGEKSVGDTYWAGFEVPYEKGVLKAVSYDGQTEGASFLLKTTGAASSLRLVADRTSITANGQDLLYVTIELVDAEGQVVRDSRRQISLRVEGQGSLLAAGNASPNDMESFRSARPRLYEGRALAIVKSECTAGEIRLIVSCEGLADQHITVLSH